MTLAYNLTESKIEFLEESINRNEFEEWLIDWHPLDFREGSEEELSLYWRELMGRDPAADLLEYLRTFKKNTEWDRISEGIRKISGSFS